MAKPTLSVVGVIVKDICHGTASLGPVNREAWSPLLMLRNGWCMDWFEAAAFLKPHGTLQHLVVFDGLVDGELDLEPCLLVCSSCAYAYSRCSQLLER